MKLILYIFCLLVISLVKAKAEEMVIIRNQLELYELREYLGECTHIAKEKINDPIFPNYYRVTFSKKLPESLIDFFTKHKKEFKIIQDKSKSIPHIQIIQAGTIKYLDKSCLKLYKHYESTYLKEIKEK